MVRRGRYALAVRSDGPCSGVGCRPRRHPAMGSGGAGGAGSTKSQLAGDTLGFPDAQPSCRPRRMTGLLQDFTSAQADSRPDSLAIVQGDTCLTYADLEDSSDRLARLLVDAGCQDSDRIALLMPRSADAVIAMHGVLKAGCIYVPLDPAGPAGRLERIVRACEPTWVLAAGNVEGLLDDLLDHLGPEAPAVGWMPMDTPQDVAFTPRFTGHDLLAAPAVRPPSHRVPSDPAHILFTSGSTGLPKGVVITHGNVTAFVEWAVGYFGIGPDDQTAGPSPFHFDLSTFDIYGTFAAGATMHLLPPLATVLPPTLAEFLRSGAITQWFSVPSMLSYMAQLDVIRQGDFPAMRRIMWCGEVFQTPDLIHWMTRVPHASFTNLYGPTEATIASSYFTLVRRPSDPTEQIPIGRPCDGEGLLVLDEHLLPVPVGDLGDLYITGAGLSPGYWRDQEKTDKAFVYLPDDHSTRAYRTGDLAHMDADGIAYFHGRADYQIKSRGYRIELGEIETALRAIDHLRECAVVAIPTTRFQGSLICCAYVPTDSSVTPAGIREAVKAVLPNYMLPARWLAMEMLPRNVNGKVDRPAVAAAFTD